MNTNAAAKIHHLEDRLARLEIQQKKDHASLGNLNQLSQLVNGLPPSAGLSITAIHCATTTSTFSAKNASTGVAGSGTVQCSDIDPSTGAITTNESLTVFNWLATTLVSGVDVILGWAPNLTLGGGKGCWIIIQKFC